METNKTIKTYVFINLFFIILVTLCQSKCQSNQNMKYDLNYTSQLVGYHSLCSQFSKRTCCSGKNFDMLAKKISTKLIGQQNYVQHKLSSDCRRKLTTLLCSTCDSDIGQKTVEGVCPSVCISVYQACRNDFFSIDSLNKIKVCRQDDIICSKLQDIIKNTSESEVFCQMFGLDTAKHDCWTGVPSYLNKGIPKKKINYHVKSHKSRSHIGTSFLEKIFSKIESKHLFYIGLVSFLICLLAYKFISVKLGNEARKIKNL